MEEEKKRI